MRRALAPRLLLLLLLAAAAAAGHCLPIETRSSLGSSTPYQTLAQGLYKKSVNFAEQYKASPAPACSKRGGSLCASSSGDDAYAAIGAITVATAPPTFNASNRADTGGLKLVSAVRDQGGCSTCTSAAVIGAAEAAISAALRRDADRRRWSVQDLAACTGGGAGGTCKSTFTMKEALDALLKGRKPPIVLEKCLPYNMHVLESLAPLCNYRCNDTDPGLSKGSLRYMHLKSRWEIQAHVRQWGAVLSRMDILSDTRLFFTGEPGGVYMPSPNATLREGHAALIVGYNDMEQYWLVKLSRGPSFGMRGLVRVSYNATATDIANPSDTFGMTFELNNPQPPRWIRDALMDTAGCATTAPPKGMWLATVAAELSLDIGQVLMDNTAVIKDLRSPLQGQKLKLCGIPDALRPKRGGGGSGGGGGGENKQGGSGVGGGVDKRQGGGSGGGARVADGWEILAR